ncbi:MAG: peptidase M56, partial [Oscillospiraceae bacterium]|nr:peptidase M56 [Oscillospiraceae bacterium]
MSAVFLKILNMGIATGWLILAVALARLLLKKAPRWLVCLLWAPVGVRLALPFSLESALSLIPSRETVPADIASLQQPVIHSGV